MHRKLTRTFPFCIAAIALGASTARPQAVTGLATMRVASGLNQPIYVTAPPRDSTHLYIVEKAGQILILDLRTGLISPTPFLDIGSRISTSGEQGLLGMAFDPSYATNGKFYVDYVAPGGAFGNGTTHISQFTASVRNTTALPSSEKILLRFDQPGSNHNGGWIGFSPRRGDTNNLYIDTGDGGCCNDWGDGHIEPGGNAQNTTTLLGKILRIKINASRGTYTVPTNNPFFGTPNAAREIFAFGLRNPFRASFDRQTGDMLIGDVGQDTREEVDMQRASNPNGGENYGWRLREGMIATPLSGIGGDRPPGNVDPILDYGRSTGGTVIGGYIYRGAQIPSLQGWYVFGDFLYGKIFLYNARTADAATFQDITNVLFPTSTEDALNNPCSFGEDASGELYIVDIIGGKIFKIVSTTESPPHGGGGRN